MDITLTDQVHPKLKLMSYSSNLSLHACPRRFQLDKLKERLVYDEQGNLIENPNVTFAYGHSVGAGIQEYLQSQSTERAIFAAFLAWDAPLWDEEEKAKKSLCLAIHAVAKFPTVFNGIHLGDYDLAYIGGKPAIELSFRIVLPDGFIYRGYVDAVLVHRESKKFRVLECKTTKNRVDEAQYKNSAQALGYSIILDTIAPGASEYEVLYLVYHSMNMEYEALPFGKSYLQRAVWIQQLLYDCEMIKMYSAGGLFPQHGESCYDYFRQCDWFNLCGMKTENLVDTNDVKVEDKEYTINLNLLDLVNSQLEREIV
jgi:hypothetical protein